VALEVAEEFRHSVEHKCKCVIEWRWSAETGNPAHFMQGEILPIDNGVRYMLDVANFYIPPTEPDDRTLLNGLDYQPARDEIEDLTYWDFAYRLADTEAYLEQTDTFLADITPGFTREGLGAAGLILIYPTFTEPLITPLFGTPDQPVVFLAALRFAPDPTAAHRMITANRHWYDEAIRLGGPAYPADAIPSPKTTGHTTRTPLRSSYV
jgi:hypothetical protein